MGKVWVLVVEPLSWAALEKPLTSGGFKREFDSLPARICL